jgi:hypothetical protein
MERDWCGVASIEIEKRQGGSGARERGEAETKHELIRRSVRLAENDEGKSSCDLGRCEDVQRVFVCSRGVGRTGSWLGKAGQMLQRLQITGSTMSSVVKAIVGTNVH